MFKIQSVSFYILNLMKHTRQLHTIVYFNKNPFSNREIHLH